MANHFIRQSSHYYTNVVQTTVAMAPNKKSPSKNASPAKKASSSKHRAPSSSGGGGTTTLWQKILDNTNFLTATTGEDKVPRAKVVSLCGLPSETGSYKNAITALKKKNYADVDKESIWLTDLGRENAEAVDTAKSNEEQLEMAKERIKGTKGKKMLDILEFLKEVGCA